MKKTKVLTLLFICLFSADAFAGGFYLPGRGVKPLGKAGAFVASGGGDLNSLWYNPANLATITDLQLVIDLGLINLSLEHTRAPRTFENGDVENFETIENSAAPKIDPQILIGGPLFENMTWAFGIYAPYLSGHTFPEDGPQRYVLVDNDKSLLLILHLAVAYNFGDSFRIGFGIQNVPASFELVTVSSGATGLFGDAEDADLDILSEVVLQDFFSPSANFGVWARFSENLSGAISFQAPIQFKDNDAKLRVRLPSHPEFSGAKLNGDSLTGEMWFPPVVRAGVSLDVGSLNVELAAVWEGWSILDEIKVQPNDISVENLYGIGNIPIGALTIPTKYQDTYSVRLGGEYDISETLQLRAGYGFETSAIPDEYYTVFLIDNDKHMMALGGSLKLSDSVAIDAGLAYYLMPDRNVTNSKWRQINPTDTSGKVTSVVGNGEYKQSYFVSGVGTRIDF